MGRGVAAGFWEGGGGGCLGGFAGAAVGGGVACGVEVSGVGGAAARVLSWPGTVAGDLAGSSLGPQEASIAARPMIRLGRRRVPLSGIEGRLVAIPGLR